MRVRVAGRARTPQPGHEGADYRDARRVGVRRRRVSVQPTRGDPLVAGQEIAREVAADVRDELVEFGARWRANQSAYPRFTASAAVVGCGPIIPGEPLTARQEAYVRAGGVRDQRRAAGVGAAEDSALVRALRAARPAVRAGSVEEEPGDLLELLEDQQLGRAVTAASTGELLSRPSAAPPRCETLRRAARSHRGQACSRQPAAAESRRATSGDQDSVSAIGSNAMIAIKPVRLLSLAIVAPVVVSGFPFGGDLLDTTRPGRSGGPGERTAGVVAYVLDGDTVQVTTEDGREVRVMFLGISAPETLHPGKPGKCYGFASCATGRRRGG